MRLETFVCAFFVLAHQARISRHIGGEDRGQSTGGGRSGHCWATLTSAANLTFFERGSVNFIWQGLRTPELQDVEPGVIVREIHDTLRIDEAIGGLDDLRPV